LTRDVSKIHTGFVIIEGHTLDPSFDERVKGVAARLMVLSQVAADVFRERMLFVPFSGGVSFMDWVWNFDGVATKSPFLVSQTSLSIVQCEDATF
jgi:hypothetical protein